MTEKEKKEGAKRFAEAWRGRGDEKQETQVFWIALLREVFGVEAPEKIIQFEKRAKLDATGFIDAYLPATRVLIEQKSADVDLRKPQSTGLTPYQQARQYAAALPHSEHPRWIVTCNFREFLIYDQEKPAAEPESIRLENLPKEYYRLAFLVEEQRELLKREEEVSIKAGEIVGRLYDALLRQYADPDDPATLHSLNVLCVRLVFCLYAEDAGIFGVRNQFADYIRKFPVEMVRRALLDLFRILDTPIPNRDPYEDPALLAFPYVNGGLFATGATNGLPRAFGARNDEEGLSRHCERSEAIQIPQFTQEIVDILLHRASEDFDWSQISPTIFGAVFESTLNPETRRKSGMHYTSIENIHKVIDPLFLDDLKAELADIRTLKQPRAIHARADAFTTKLASLAFLDPACGSGNFLTETYISLRRLENDALRLVCGDERLLNLEGVVKVDINQFHGIEINDFAVTVAKTALWIAESQMLRETETIVQANLDFLPLKSYTGIVEGNALRMDWGAGAGPGAPVSGTLSDSPGGFVRYPETENPPPVPAQDNFSTTPPPSLRAAQGAARQSPAQDMQCVGKRRLRFDYIMGNPPFVGKKEQTRQQKEELLSVVGSETKGGGNLDYVAGWYFKAAKFTQGTSARVAFVSTNSITQGEQVSTMWRPLCEHYGIHINFAHRTFKWDSEATDKAAVHCVVIGFSHVDEHPKTIFESGKAICANEINPYLVDAPTVLIGNRAKRLCDAPDIMYGSMPIDDGHLILDKGDYDALLAENEANAKFARKYIGGVELLRNRDRWCLWLEGISPSELQKSRFVMERLKRVKEFRESSGRGQTKALAETPALFGEIRQPQCDMLVIPKVSSENRKYLPIGFVSPEVIVNGSALIIPGATLYHFGVLSSKVHMAWMRTVAGRMKSDYQYSGSIVYNNFPWPFADIPAAGAQGDCHAASRLAMTAGEDARTVRSAGAGRLCPGGRLGEPTLPEPPLNPGNPENPCDKITETAQAILDARALYPDASLADLYDPLTMPPDLRRAHRANDAAVLAAYGLPPDIPEPALVAHLMGLYQKFSHL